MCKCSGMGGDQVRLRGLRVRPGTAVPGQGACCACPRCCAPTLRGPRLATTLALQ